MDIDGLAILAADSRFQRRFGVSLGIGFMFQFFGKWWRVGSVFRFPPCLLPTLL